MRSRCWARRNGRPFDDPHRFKKPVAVHETAVIDRNDGLGFGHKLAVEKNGHVFLMPSNYPKCLSREQKLIRDSPISRIDNAPKNFCKKDCPVLVETGI